MRSTMPEAARSGRHSSSRTVKNQRRGASPASARACEAATVPSPSDQAASIAAAVSWVSASPIREMSMQTAGGVGVDAGRGLGGEGAAQRAVQDAQQRAVQRVDRVPVAGVVAAVQGDRAHPVGSLVEHPQQVGQERSAALWGALAQMVQTRGEHRLLVVVHRPPAHDRDQRRHHVEHAAVGLGGQHLARLAADPCGGGCPWRPGRGR